MLRRRRNWPLRLLVSALLAAAAGLAALIWLEPDQVGPPLATTPSVVPAKQVPKACQGPGASAETTAANAGSLQSLAWSSAGRDTVGWEIYEPLVGQQIASPCPADSPGFAVALSRWQAAHSLSASGRMDATSFETIWYAMLRRRPFVQAMQFGCPPPLAASDMEPARPDEAFAGQTTIMAGREALQAYRAMLAAARAEEPAIRSDPQALKIISAFRAPQADGTDCPPGQACSNLTRASCSAHRTGRAFDLYVGAAPGGDPTSTADDNRLYQSRTLAYRWLASHAAQFGFLPYPYEPWHWEWAG